MRSLIRTGLRSRWPFWLLMLAWVCASCPLAVVDTVMWLGEARTFSHQQRLAKDVARVMAEAESPSLVANLAATSPSPAEPAIPFSVALKKIELASEQSSLAIIFAVPAIQLPGSEFRLESATRGPPPHEPPRATG